MKVSLEVCIRLRRLNWMEITWSPTISVYLKRVSVYACWTPLCRRIHANNFVRQRLLCSHSWTSTTTWRHIKNKCVLQFKIKYTHIYGSQSRKSINRKRFEFPGVYAKNSSDNILNPIFTFTFAMTAATVFRWQFWIRHVFLLKTHVQQCLSCSLAPFYKMNHLGPKWYSSPLKRKWT